MKKILKNILLSLLQVEAKFALKRHEPKVIAITGSVGKTSAKDAVGAAISKATNVRKSEKSFNSEIGIPLTILGLKNPWSNPFKWIITLVRGLFVALDSNYPDTLVLEVGADKPGDISKLADWLKTDVVVFTQFAEVPVHISNFPSRKSMLKEKLSLLDTLRPGGTVVMNMDNEELASAIEEKIEGKNISTQKYGLLPPVDLIGSNISFTTNDFGDVDGFTFKIENDGSVFPLKVEGVLGDQHIYPLLAGFAVGKALEINPVKILEGLNDIERQPGRMKILRGIKGSIIIDDSYNSSPIAAAKALETLEKIPVRGRRVAILGDMLELGEHTEAEHKKIGSHASRASNLLVAVGEHARHTAEGALSAGMHESKILQFETSQKAGKYIERLIGEGDVILVKGSQGKLRMEKAVLEIMAEPERKKELLVRQEKEWEKR